MDKFFEDSVQRNTDSEWQMFATYKDCLSFFRRTDIREPIVFDDTEEVVTARDELTRTGKTHPMDGN